MPGIAKLHLEDSLEDGPQTRGLLNLFEKDAASLKKYTVGLHNCCQRILSAQNELCAATQSLAQQLRSYELQKFPLEPEDSILTSTLKQFATYLDDVSSVQQVLAAQYSETMMFPLSKFLQNDIEEVSTMFELFQIATEEHEQAMGKYMKLSKKKDNDRLRREVDEELYTSRKKFHQTAQHYYASLNALQYKRKCFLLEPILGYMHAQRAFFQMGHESVGKREIEDFLSNIATSVQGVQQELNQETQKTVELIDTLESQSSHLYHPEPLIEMPYIPPNTALLCKAGYLFMRSKQSLIATKWERSYFFTQGGNLMCQTKEEVAGSLVLDLNDEGLVAEISDTDDRRFGFVIHVLHSKKSVYLQAENERERDEWISTLNNIVRSGKTNKGKPAETTTKKSKENEQNKPAVHLKVEWIEPSEQGHQTSSVPDKIQQSWNEMEMKLPKVEILSDSDSVQELPTSALQNHEGSAIYSHQENKNSEYGTITFGQNQYPSFSSTLYQTVPRSNRINVPLDVTFENEEKVFNFQNLPNQEQMRRQGLFNNSHDLLTSENRIVNGDSEDLNQDEPLIWEPEMPTEHDYLDPQGQPIGTGLEAILPGSDLYYEIVQTHENLTFPNSSLNATQSRLQFLEKLKTKMQNKIAYYDKNKLTVKCSNNSDEKRVWDKQHFCMYCRRGSTNLAKHILHCHKNEEEVIGILQCNLRSKQRVYLLDKLRFIGDYMHNMDVLKKEAGVIIAWRSPPDPVPVSNFVPCQHCLAFFQRKDLLRHDRTCKFQPQHRDNQINLKDLLSQSSLLLPVSYRIQRQMASEVLSALPDDPLSQGVKNDDLILKFGSKLYQQVSHVPNCAEMVCESMQELSQLVIDIQSKDPSVDCLADCINPERFSFVVSCLRGVCNKKKPGQVSGMERTSSVSSIRETRAEVFTHSASVDETGRDFSSLLTRKTSTGNTSTNAASTESFLPDVPIQFDLMSPSEENFPVLDEDGQLKRINPFDQLPSQVLTSRVDNESHFSKRFVVRFIGSMEVPQDRGEALVTNTMRHIMVARAIHNVLKMTQSEMSVSDLSVRLIDSATNNIRTTFALSDISYWCGHKENDRLLGFITVNREQGSSSYTCHVFESNTPASEICQSIGTATTMAFEALMKRNMEKKRMQENQLLLSNIGNLENKEDPGTGCPPSITPDGKYLILTDVHVSPTKSEQEDVFDGASAAAAAITEKGDSEA